VGVKRVAILLSGIGSNFMALSDQIEAGRIAGKIVAVLSNIPNAPGLQEAERRGYSTFTIPSRGKNRSEFDQEAVRCLQEQETEVVCLAGFMRLLSPTFVQAYPNRILNIHPSLLPAFPGLHAQQQALEWGAKVSGCTVHFVDEKLDHGPIILQRSVPVLDDDTEETLSARILEQEHIAYPEALALICADRIRIEQRRCVVL